MNKKIIFHSSFALLLALSTSSLTSCESLDQGNLSELAESNLPQSDADAQALVNAVYSNNITMCTSFMYLFDLTTETTVSGENPNGGGGMLGLLAWDGTNYYVVSAWTTIYTAIARANDTIEKLEQNPAGVTPAIASRVIGEAKFLRAYWYNYAVQIWGPIPLVTSTTEGKFQESADVMFNSALNIEFAVLRTHAEIILSSVPKNCPEYSEAHRLLKFIHFFLPISDKEIPPTSIMREFVGGSSFKYKY